MVGSNKDAGYNEAVYDGSQTLAKDPAMHSTAQVGTGGSE